MARCVVGAWQDTLDREDVEALRVFRERSNSMAELHGVFLTAGVGFGLTATKDHEKTRCVCYREKP